MALYTSFYTRQLALRPEALGGGGVEQEGEKTHQKTVARRTVDYAGPYVTWFEVRVGWGGWACQPATLLRLCHHSAYPHHTMPSHYHPPLA